MFSRITHYLYWIPAKLRGRISRSFQPKGLDFSNELAVDFEREKGYNLRITDLCTFHYVLAYFMKHFRPRQEISLFDVGAGKGLLLFEAKKTGISKIGGVELSDKCFEILLKNRDILKADDVECHHGDATQLAGEIDGYNTFYLANPFPKPVMTEFVQTLIRSAKRQPRKILVIYHYPTCEEVYPEAGFERIGELVIKSPYDFQRNIPTVFFRYPPN